MIFDQNCNSRDDFNDYHDEIIVADADFIGQQSICGLYLHKGRGASRNPYEDSDSTRSISSSMVVGRNLRSQGNESPPMSVPDDTTIDILSVN